MSAKVLRPQDYLIERIKVAPSVFQHHRRESFNASGYGSANPKVTSRKPVTQPEQKKRIDRNGRSETSMSSLDGLRRVHSNNSSHLAMGQVTMLRRGRAHDPRMNGVESRRYRPAKETSDDLVGYRSRFAPYPGTFRQQIRIGELKSSLLSSVSTSGERPDVYAGSAISMSPSPRSLPLPSFFDTKQISEIFDDAATRELRRLLRLDLL